jgi:hypothetical protein
MDMEAVRRDVNEKLNRRGGFHIATRTRRLVTSAAANKKGALASAFVIVS